MSLSTSSLLSRKSFKWPSKPFLSPRRSRSPRTLSVVLAALCTVSAIGCHGKLSTTLAHFRHRVSKSKPNTDQFADNIQQVISKPKMAELKWSDFSDFQTEVQQFYANRNGELAWTRDGKPTEEASALMEAFSNAVRKGLVPADYDADRWAERVARLERIRSSHDTGEEAQNTIAQFDAAMTITAMRYISDLHVGRINPQALNFDIDVPGKRAAFDLAAFVNDQLVDADNVPSTIASVEPQNPMYKATEDALGKYLDLAGQAGGTPATLPAVAKPVAVGGSYPALPQLLARLALEGDGSAGEGASGFDQTASDSVKHFQQRHGLTDDGKLSQATVDALNVPMGDRVQQLNLALERWRWLPDAYMQPRLLVNLAEFYVRAYDADHHLAFKMKTVNGEVKGDHETPVFVRTMKYMIFRPYWNLPPSIVKKELLRHVNSGGAGYLERNNYEVVGASGQQVSGWTARDLEHSRYLVRQKPGPKNSLGLVKFMFPNEYDIYMHSTPEINLFNLTRRDRSHGCIRLNDAEKMANWVLSGQGDWDADKIHQAMFGEPLDSDNASPAGTSDQEQNGGTATDTTIKNNKQVNLKTQLPVVVGYFTAMADEDGTMHFFNDIYGYDKQLLDALDKSRPYPKDPVKINPKLTPGETV